MQDEVWADIPGFEGRYQASTSGRMRSLARRVKTWNGYKSIEETILKFRVQSNGYLRWKDFLVHRVVADTFLSKDGRVNLQVNHKNGIKSDNRVENLEWCTAKENSDHKWETGLANDETRLKMSLKAKERTGSKNSCWKGEVLILSKLGEQLAKVESLVAAQDWVRKNSQYSKAAKGNICNVCHGVLKSAYGFVFKYAEGATNE